jgi:hypothetical protein
MKNLYTNIVSWSLLVLASILVILTCMSVKYRGYGASWGLLIVATVWMIMKCMNSKEDHEDDTGN